LPKLSILLPTYNGERFLAEQLESILAQTDPDFELIAIDDGSADGTVAVLERFAARDRRIAVIPSQGNRGQNGRLVELLEHARGEFIAISDQDDRWAPDRNEKLFEALGDRQVVFARSELIGAGGERLHRTLLESLGHTPAVDDRLTALIAPMYSAHAMVVRRDAVVPEALFQRLPFDWLIGAEAALAGSLKYRDDAVVLHRLHSGNQHNIFHQARATRPLSRSSLSLIFMFRTAARIKQMDLFDYLGRSRRLDRSLQRDFLMLANRCQLVWFSPWRALRSDGGLRDLIVDTLASRAGSPDDLQRFRAHIDVLTQPSLSAPVRAAYAQRYAWVSGRAERDRTAAAAAAASPHGR